MGRGDAGQQLSKKKKKNDHLAYFIYSSLHTSCHFFQSLCCALTARDLFALQFVSPPGTVFFSCEPVTLATAAQELSSDGNTTWEGELLLARTLFVSAHTVLRHYNCVSCSASPSKHATMLGRRSPTNPNFSLHGTIDRQGRATFTASSEATLAVEQPPARQIAAGAAAPAALVAALRANAHCLRTMAVGGGVALGGYCLFHMLRSIIRRRGEVQDVSAAGTLERSDRRSAQVEALLQAAPADALRASGPEWEKLRAPLAERFMASAREALRDQLREGVLLRRDPLLGHVAAHMKALLAGRAAHLAAEYGVEPALQDRVLQLHEHIMLTAVDEVLREREEALDLLRRWPLGEAEQVATHAAEIFETVLEESKRDKGPRSHAVVEREEAEWQFLPRRGSSFVQ